MDRERLPKGEADLRNEDSEINDEERTRGKARDGIGERRRREEEEGDEGGRKGKEGSVSVFPLLITLFKHCQERREGTKLMEEKRVDNAMKNLEFDR
uniref:Uncharacterized protein n=1 Tax=Pristionchus pacificus TaxID=54126 RepID=A0A2A6B8T3_PRIPA|eukprot:PDM62274.1 hypothetical protein PRIPAC_51716 [Pristionchus pacificus]